MTSTPSLAERGQRLGLRAIGRLGGLPLLRREEVRRVVADLLRTGTRHGAEAELLARRTIARRPGPAAPARPRPVRRGDDVDLTPTEDQAMLRDAARELAEEVLRPAARRADVERTVADEVRVAAVDMGLHLLGVPESLGGITDERSAVTGVLVLEELARGDLGLAVALMAPAAVATAIAAYGSADQQATYLPHLAGADPAVAALAIHEPQPLFDPFAPRTVAVRRGDRLVIDGVKSLVPYAATADLLLVSALVDGVPRLVLLEAGTPGITVEDDPAMGLRAAATARVHLRQVETSTDTLVGSPEDHRDAVYRARVAWSGAACGTAQAALDQLTPYVLEREAFGEPIAHRQAVAFALADIATELAGLRLVTWRAAARLDAGADASSLAAQARRLTARHGAAIGSQAVQLLGGHGFVRDHDNERWYRDLRGAGILKGVLLV